MGSRVAIATAWPEDEVRSTSVPWTLWACLAAVTSVVVGGHWDIAWHRAIGRDEFWTPPHIAIYFCGVLAGLSCAWMILRQTFAKAEDAVNIWGFRAPLGAFIIAWGGVMMLTSAPFDDWWHNAYGLDTKILSPPHMVLMVGVLSIEIGTLLLILGAMNRAEGQSKKWLQWMFLYIGACILTSLMVAIMELSNRVQQHSAMFYRAVSVVAPVALVAIGVASRHRWGATLAAGIHMLTIMLMIWILPLVSAEPKLGPVYVQVKHLIPPYFPVLLIVPALAIDWLRHRTASAILLGTTFLVTLIAVQWPFASFLQSGGARNWFFGSHYLGYYTHPNSNQARYLFSVIEKTSGEFWLRLAQALVIAMLMSRLGLAAGRWMRSVVR